LGYAAPWPRVLEPNVRPASAPARMSAPPLTRQRLEELYTLYLLFLQEERQLATDLARLVRPASEIARGPDARRYLDLVN